MFSAGAGALFTVVCALGVYTVFFFLTPALVNTTCNLLSPIIQTMPWRYSKGDCAASTVGSALKKKSLRQSANSAATSARQ
jgi:hypothetical protein